VAVRRSLPDGLVLVACSGGADSLALAAAAAFEARGRVGLVTVDHGLHPASAAVAARLLDQTKPLGFEPLLLETVTVGTHGGPEAAARDARYAALTRVATTYGAAAVLLAHTLDDQAETVLLGLARGSGTRSLAGMPAVRGIFRRPLLDVPRAVVRQACADEGLEPWEDPANTDPRFTRSRVRHDVLPSLESSLGPGVAAALARTARAARDDADALDEIASAADPFVDHQALIAVLEDAVPALRRRWLRSAALAVGCSASALNAGHVDAMDAVIMHWRGQGPVHLPGGATARRTCGRLVLAPAGAHSDA